MAVSLPAFTPPPLFLGSCPPHFLKINAVRFSLTPFHPVTGAPLALFPPLRMFEPTPPPPFARSFHKRIPCFLLRTPPHPRSRFTPCSIPTFLLSPLDVCLFSSPPSQDAPSSSNPIIRISDPQFTQRLLSVTTVSGDSVLPTHSPVKKVSANFPR